MDNDNDLDIVAGNEDGNLFYFENQGTPSLAEWVEVSGYFGSIDVGSDCAPTVGDLTINNNLDVITGDLFHEIQFFENIEGTWTENPIPVSGITGGQNATPALVDLDNDGDLDMAIGNYDGTFNYYINLHIVVSTDPDEQQNNSFKLNNFPNPFSRSTTISFYGTTNLQKCSQINIYNVRGQLVRELRLSPSSLPPLYSVTWDGKNQSGEAVKPGIYFYKLVIDGTTKDVEKCLLVR